MESFEQDLSNLPIDEIKSELEHLRKKYYPFYCRGVLLNHYMTNEDGKNLNNVFCYSLDVDEKVAALVNEKEEMTVEFEDELEEVENEENVCLIKLIFLPTIEINDHMIKLKRVGYKFLTNE